MSSAKLVQYTFSTRIICASKIRGYQKCGSCIQPPRHLPPFGILWNWNHFRYFVKSANSRSRYAALQKITYQSVPEAMRPWYLKLAMKMHQGVHYLTRAGPHPAKEIHSAKLGAWAPRISDHRPPCRLWSLSPRLPVPSKLEKEHSTQFLSTLISGLASPLLLEPASVAAAQLALL